MNTLSKESKSTEDNGLIYNCFRDGLIYLPDVLQCGRTSRSLYGLSCSGVLGEETSDCRVRSLALPSDSLQGGVHTLNNLVSDELLKGENLITCDDAVSHLLGSPVTYEVFVAPLLVQFKHLGLNDSL